MKDIGSVDLQKIAKDVFNTEIEALGALRDEIIRTTSFQRIVRAIVDCRGKLVITGMGKPGHIGHKMAATFASLGTPSFFLHPAEALHGDLGMVTADDVVLAMSYSGESDEILNILPSIKLKNATLIGITGRKNSSLAKYCDIVQVLPSMNEADNLGLAPTSSTTCELVYGDALAIACSQIYGFSKENFGANHPAGLLGKKLRFRVSDIMKQGNEQAIVREDSLFKDAMIEMSKKYVPIVCMVDEDQVLKGIITDGDVRRLLEKHADIYNMKAADVMTRQPHTCSKDTMAVVALEFMKENRFSSMPVIEEGKLIGTIMLWDILRTGIVI